MTIRTAQVGERTQSFLLTGLRGFLNLKSGTSLLLGPALPPAITDLLPPQEHRLPQPGDVYFRPFQMARLKG